MRFADKCDILVDHEDGMVLIQRVPHGSGISFCPVGRSARAEAGIYGRGMLKFTPSDEACEFFRKYEDEQGYIVPRDVDVTDEGILILLGSKP